MKQEKIFTAIAAATFFVLICTAALLSSGDFLGRTLGAAFLPGAKGEAETALKEDGAKAGVDLEKIEPLPPEQINTRTLWLARCIYSETKRPEEQELVGWVVRNRVETGYRGNSTYREAVLDPYQFSAFNPGSRKRGYYSSLASSSTPPGWQRALAVAHHVLNAPASMRPFSEGTRHFFSERSMKGQKSPSWAESHKKVKPAGFDIDEHRFRFYEDIS